MTADACDYIEPVILADNLIFFYWGRHPGHGNLDMQLGGGAWVIHDGRDAVVVDSMNLPGQGSWVRRYMEEKYGITRFTLVNTHCHEDHIAENHVYADSTIIAHEDTRRLMMEHRKSLERGSPGVPAFPVVLPDVTFRQRLDIWCGHTLIELHEFAIHERGHIAAYLPRQQTILVGDMLEDPVWIFHFDVAPADVQIAELKRMAAMDLQHIYPAHGDIDTIRNGGYGTSFIQCSIGYLEKMLAASQRADFMASTAQDYIAAELDKGELHWWPPYEQVHAMNLRTLQQLAD